MRRALLGNPRITTRHGAPGWGYFGRHAGYDYGVNGAALVAPEAGTIINIYRGTPGGGNIIELRGKYTHRFLHLRSIAVKKGQKVKEGQRLGTTGSTGKVTGPHLHHDTRKNGTAWNSSYSNYVDWEKLLKSKPKPKPQPKEVEVKTTRGLLSTAYLHVLGRKRRTGEGENVYLGKPLGQVYRWLFASKEYQTKKKQREKMVTDLRTALNNERNKPPKTVIKEVEKIVEKEVPVEVKVGEEEAVRGFFSKLLDLVFRRQG